MNSETSKYGMHNQKKEKECAIYAQERKREG